MKTLQNVIRVYSASNELLLISDTWSSAWSLEELKRIATRHLEGTGGSYFTIQMLDGTEYKSA